MIPHNRPTLGKEEELAALRVLQSGWLAQGKEVESFENEICEFVGLPDGHAVAVSSGTAALFLALWTLEARGKEVAFPVYSCSALRNAVGMVGAEELLLDISSNGPNVDLDLLNESGADIAIIPHMFGLPMDLSGLNGIEIIEDCAQALGASVNGEHVGLQGEVGIFSFSATKLITSSGQGGMLISKHKALIDAVRDYREFDCRRDDKKRFNFQMTDLQAAIGREQLRKLPSFLFRRNEIFDRYRQAGLELLDVDFQFDTQLVPVRYRAILRIRFPCLIINSFEHNIETIVPIEDQELLGDRELFPNAWKLTAETVSLPIYPSLENWEIDRILLSLERRIKLNV